MYTDSFGFLPEPVNIDFGVGRIRSLDDHASVLEGLHAETNPDGFFYPPTQVTMNRSWDDSKAEPTEVEGSRRPAQIYIIPASHEIELDSPIGKDVRVNDASFIIQLLAFLYGRRLQFFDWGFDGRIPLKQSTHHVDVLEKTAAEFVSTAYETWRALSETERRRVTNFLFLHSKAETYEWEWEWFIWEYMVTDAIFCHVKNVNKLSKKIDHSKRIEYLCKTFNIWNENTKVVEDIVRLRNTLFHEALWDGTSPGYAFSQDGWRLTHQLRCLNQRLIPALLGWKGAYISNPWTNWRSRKEFK